jgi:hypothetical protein
MNIANLRTKFFHDSNSLAAKSCRKIRFVTTRTAVEGLSDKFTPPLLNIQKVNTRSFDAYSHLPRPGNRSGEFLPLHHLWTAVAVNANGAHQVRLAFFIATLSHVY